MEERIAERIAKGDLATYEETLLGIAEAALERLEMLFGVGFDDSDAGQVCHLGEALIRDARILLNEGNDYIEKEFGSVAIRRVCHGQIGFIANEMLCVDFEPPDKDISKEKAAQRLNPGR